MGAASAQRAHLENPEAAEMLEVAATEGGPHAHELVTISRCASSQVRNKNFMDSIGLGLKNRRRNGSRFQAAVFTDLLL